MRIVVLGASGQIGSVVFEELKKTSHEVVGTTRENRNGLLQFDPFRDEWKMLGKADVVINCVGQIEPERDSSFYKIHVDLCSLIIQNREALGNPRIIQISALGASTDHRVEFLRTKGVADEYLGKFLNTIVVRPSIVCTHRTMLVKKMLMLHAMSRYAGGFVLVPKGFAETKIQPVLATDLALIIHKLCDEPSPSKVVSVVGPDRLSFREIMSIMFNAGRERYRLLTVPKVVADVFVKYVVCFVFPGVINMQQYQLLFEDNVSDNAFAGSILGRPLNSVKPFLIEEFNNASN